MSRGDRKQYPGARHRANADRRLSAHDPIKGSRKLDPWPEGAKASLVGSFANGVQKDIAAVRNAIISPWSNRQTEGQITKLKLIKRQMDGRAKIDLLQARLVGARLVGAT